MLIMGINQVGRPVHITPRLFGARVSLFGVARRLNILILLFSQIVFCALENFDSVVYSPHLSNTVG